MLVLGAVFEAGLQVIWLAALALGFLGAAKVGLDTGEKCTGQRFSSSLNLRIAPEGLVTSFLEISLRVPDSLGQGGAGWGRRV